MSEWAGCLGVADTKRFFALIGRLWKQNPEVSSAFWILMALNSASRNIRLTAFEISGFLAI
jgi:hypothetical protein